MAYGRVLLTENDRNMRTLLYDLLTQAGFIVTSTIQTGLSTDMINRRTADIALLAVTPGADYCRRLLSDLGQMPEIPVVVILSEEEKNQRLEYMALGADDVLIKPIDIEETVLRLRSIIRRFRLTSARAAAGSVSVPACGIEVDMYSYTATADGKTVKLPPKELEILNLLLNNPNRVFRRGEIAAHIWGENLSSERTVDSHINRIKRLLGEPCAGYIVSVRGVGYKLSVPTAVRPE